MWAVQEGERWKKAACGAGGAEHIAWGALGRLGEKQQGGQETVGVSQCEAAWAGG